LRFVGCQRRDTQIPRPVLSGTHDGESLSSGNARVRHHDDDQAENDKLPAAKLRVNYR
jgi:hypothetical protein